jgi:hypothetical protein
MNLDKINYLTRPEPHIIDRLMANYLDIETLLDVYSQNNTSHLPFEDSETLFALSVRFALPPAANFWELLRHYDLKYPTSRTYFRFRSGKVLLKHQFNIPLAAAAAGNIQALVDYFKVGSQNRELVCYRECRKAAAEGGHEVVLDLLTELIQDCDEGSICVHYRDRSRCKDCGGSQICEHQRLRARCKDCGGSQICEHQRLRARCKDCGGSQFCEHQRLRSQCRECRPVTQNRPPAEHCCHHRGSGASICPHQRLRSQCSECRPPPPQDQSPTKRRRIA